MVCAHIQMYTQNSGQGGLEIEMVSSPVQKTQQEFQPAKLFIQQISIHFI